MSTIKLGHQLAFPHHEVWDEEKTEIGWIGGGLTKREFIAAMAMQGMALKDRGHYNQTDIEGKYHLSHPRWVADAAVDYADALLAALEAKT